MFTVLEAFGSVTTSHSSSSTRFSMVLSLDFSATGQITAAHLQVPAGPVTWRDGRAVAETEGPRVGVNCPCAVLSGRAGSERSNALLCCFSWTKGAPNGSRAGALPAAWWGTVTPSPGREHRQNSAGMKSL